MPLPGLTEKEIGRKLIAEYQRQLLASGVNIVSDEKKPPLTSKERSRVHTKKKKAEGLVRFSRWVHKDNLEKINSSIDTIEHDWLLDNEPDIEFI